MSGRQMDEALRRGRFFVFSRKRLDVADCSGFNRLLFYQKLSSDSKQNPCLESEP